ncbi:hypothetical protein K439DRAFT_1623047 [Ramaria rubella]|nr:hypothetical protein K439DRAFT_1623047 [Ramaria rubella]
MLTLGHVDVATRSNATGHAASLSVDHTRTHDSSAPTRPLAPNATLPPTTPVPWRRTHYGRPIGRAVIIETLSPPSLYPYVLARPRPMELSIVLSGQPSFSFSERSPVVSYNVMSRSRTETLALDEVESTVLGGMLGIMLQVFITPYGTPEGHSSFMVPHLERNACVITRTQAQCRSLNFIASFMDEQWSPLELPYIYI